MNDIENKLFLEISEEEAKLRIRVAYMIELSKIKNVPFTQIMAEFGLEPIL